MIKTTRDKDLLCFLSLAAFMLVGCILMLIGSIDLAYVQAFAKSSGSQPIHESFFSGVYLVAIGLTLNCIGGLSVATMVTFELIKAKCAK